MRKDSMRTNVGILAQKQFGQKKPINWKMGQNLSMLKEHKRFINSLFEKKKKNIN